MKSGGKLTAIALALLCSMPMAFADEPLQGSIEETGVAPSEAKRGNIDIMDMPTPVVPRKPLEGNISKDALDGHAEDENDPSLQRQSAQEDDLDRPPLRGHAENTGDQNLVLGDPDMDDQEMQVEWDRWRNRLLLAVQSSVQDKLNNPDDSMLRWDPSKQAVVVRFPLGTVAWFYCKVNNARKVESVTIMKSSGFPGYDKAVLHAVKDLEGSSILQFPKRSRRLFITQSAGIKTSDSGAREFFKFGDVERYRTGGQ